MQTKAEHEFEIMLDAHKGIIYKIVKLYAHHEAGRKDLFQDIILQLWKAFPKFRNEAKQSTWLYRVALNTAITSLRVRTKGVVDFVPDLSGFDRQITADSDDAENKLKFLYAAISQLNELDKALVMLYLDDKTYEEMEDIMGIGSGALRVRINRIKEKLKQLTQSNYHGAE